MPTASRERVTIDLRGLGAALKAHARVRNLAVSSLARLALVQLLNTSLPESPGEASGASEVFDHRSVKVTVRLRSGVAARLKTRARNCSLSQSAYVTTLIDETPAPSLEVATALATSTEQLAVVATDLNELIRTVRRDTESSAPLIEAWLKPLAQELRQHLTLASRLMLDLQPARRSIAHARGAGTNSRESHA